MQNLILKVVISFFSIAVWIIPVSANNNVTPYTKIFYLGDSLMDTGNVFLATAGDLFQIPPATRYYSGRFGNDLITPDYLSQMLGVCNDVKPSLSADFFTDSCVSFAFGGSGTGEFDPTPGGFPVPGLLTQSGMLAQAGVIDNRTLIVVWTGPNDLFLETRTPEQSVNNIIQALELLISSGGDNIVVMNSPDISKAPLAGENARLLSKNTKTFNKLLRKRLRSLHFAHQETHILSIDTYRPLNLLISNPKVFGFSDDVGAGPASGCLFFEIIPDCSPLIAGFETDSFFWDEVHFTTKVHYIMATLSSLLINGHQ